MPDCLNHKNAQAHFAARHLTALLRYISGYPQAAFLQKTLFFQAIWHLMLFGSERRLAG